jgi:hypothetical protein
MRASINMLTNGMESVVLPYEITCHMVKILSEIWKNNSYQSILVKNPRLSKFVCYLPLKRYPLLFDYNMRVFHFIKDVFLFVWFFFFLN